MSDVDESSLDDVEALYDENAFGIWLAWFDAEEVEYAQSSNKFPPRIQVWRSAVADYLADSKLGEGVTAIDFGTAVYVEIADGDQRQDPIAWTRGFRAFLEKGDWRTVAAVTHGGRWVAREPSALMPSKVGDVAVAVSFGPSEPFRKAVLIESVCHDDEETAEAGWGAGLFVEADVLDATGKTLKNDPTPLRCAGVCFFRLGG